MLKLCLYRQDEACYSRPMRIDINPPIAAETLLSLARDAYRHYVPLMGKEPAPMVVDYQTHIENDTIITLHEGAVLIAFAVIIEKKDGIWLETIAVADGYRGQGIGTDLMTHVEAYIAKIASSYQLYTNEVMTQNRDWYLRLGFTVTHTKKDEGYRRIFFRKEL